jgi:hypothetical protein
MSQQNEKDLIVQNANEYIASKYQNYDMVILGENHWIKNELTFLKKIIPLLYENGVRCFAFEFMAFTAQDKIDRLMAMNKFSKPVRDSIISEKSHRFIKEYMDILYVLWKLNQSSEEKIKVLGLDVPNRFPASIDRDSTMADNVIKYYSQTNNKILIHCGRNHGFTKFYQCKSPKENVVRLGNIVYQKFPDKVTNISFFPMVYSDENEKYYFLSYKDKKSVFGMDLKNSPVSKNTSGSYYLQKCDNYSLGNFYDGAVFINKKIKLCRPHKKLPEEDKKVFYDMQNILKQTKVTFISE